METRHFSPWTDRYLSDQFRYVGGIHKMSVLMRRRIKLLAKSGRSEAALPQALR